MENKLGWLHLSDLHFFDSHAWRDSPVLEKLLEDLKERRDSGLRVDLVFCTGDIGFGETSKESLKTQYEDAKSFLDTVLKTFNLPPERLFLVPGNHDIDRGKVLQSQTAWFRGGALTSANINQGFQSRNSETLQAIERLGQYREFVTSNYPHLGLNETCTFGSSIEINGITAAISGLNSAWTCAGDREMGKLWLAGEAQLHDCDKAAKIATTGTSPDLRIGLVHHPLDWLDSSEATSLRSRIQNDFDFLLHGHAHNQWVHENSRPHHVVVAAGAATAESDSEFGYNIVQLNNELTEVHLRRFDKKGGGWIGEEVYGRTKNCIWPLQPFAVTASACDPGSTSNAEVSGPVSRGRYGLARALVQCSRLLNDTKILAVFGMAGVGKSTLVDELRTLPELRELRSIQISAREDAGPLDFYSQIAPNLGIHDERPTLPAGVNPVEIAEALCQLSSSVAPFVLHVQRAHLWFSSGSWKNMEMGRLLKGLSHAYPNSVIILEAREVPVGDISSFEVTGLPIDSLSDYFSNPPGLSRGWRITGSQKKYIFQRMGGGHGYGAHAYGLDLLVRLADARGVSPYDVLKEYPEDYAEELYNKLFRDLYRNVLSSSEQEFLFACSLYREGIHYSHLPRLEKALNTGTASEALIRRRLLSEQEDWLYLHDLAAQQARRLTTKKSRTGELHRLIAGFWLEDLKGNTSLREANIRRALEALHHLEEGGEGERVEEIAPTFFGRRPEEAVATLWRMEKRFVSAGQHDKDRVVLEYLLKITPHDHRAMRFLGECRRRLYGRKDLIALELFRDAAGLSPGFTPYMANWGNAAVASESRAVLTEFIAAMESNPPRCSKDDHVIAVHASALAAVGRVEDAAKVRQEAIDAQSRNPALYADQAKWWLESQNVPEEALNVLEIADKVGCINDITEAIYAKVLEAAGRGEEAVKLRQKKIDSGSRSTAFYSDQAQWLLEHEGDPEAALKVLKRAREVGVADDFTDAISAVALEAIGRGTEAADIRQNKIEAGSLNAVFYNDQAKYLNAQGNPEGGLALLKLAERRGCTDAATEAIRAKIELCKHS